MLTLRDVQRTPTGYVSVFEWCGWVLLYMRIDEAGWPTRDAAAPEEDG